MKLFRSALTVGHICIILLLAGTMFNAVIPPHVFSWANLLSLLFPFLMLVNFALCIIWILLRKKRAFIFILITVMLYSPISRWINYSKSSTDKSNFKVVTMNIKGGKHGINRIEKYLTNINADVVLVQEYGKDFKLKDYSFGENFQPIVTMRSKCEIVNTGKIATGGNGNAIFADIKFNNQIVRVINVYLNPFSFEKEKVKPTDDFSENKHTFKYILKTLLPTFRIHEKEIRDVRMAVEESPYPVILAGDFNAVPNSYEYYQIQEKLTDAFVASGRGISTSFHDYKFPIRIDYIFASKEIKPTGYRVDRSVKLSDHYPVIATFKIE